MHSPVENDVIRRQRPYAIAMVVVEAITFGILSATGPFPEGTVFPTLIVIAAAAAALTQPLPMPTRRRRPIWILLTALVFLTAWRLADHRRENDFVSEFSPLLHVAGQAMMTVQVAMLLMRRPSGGLPPAFAWCGVIVLVTAGDVQATAGQSFFFQIAAMAFTVTAVGLFQAGRTGAVGGVRSSRLLPTVVIVLCGVVAAGLTLTAAAALRNYTRSIDRLVADLLFELQRGNGRVGFSRDPGRLGSTRDLKVEPGSTAAAVRVAGLKPPVYLRGSAFVVFTESSTGAFAWDEAMIAAEKSGNRDVSLRIPVEGVPDDDPGMFRYRAERVGTTSRDRVAKGDPTETRRVDVRLIDPGLWEDYFMPAGSVGLTSPAPKIVAGPGSVRSGGEPAEEYRLDVLADGDADRPAYIEPDFSAMADDEAAAIVWGVGLTSVPTALAGDERFEALVAEVFDGCDTVTEHVAAVQTYFVRNYRYDLQVTVPSGRNALEYFLFDRPDAYCEYFATAAAVLLRARGIPTRYVTGFVAAEKNGAGGFLTARNEDAHAWAEAYDPERGWILVEATADSGIPRTRAAPPVVAFWDTANDALLRFRAGFRRGGWYWLFLATLRSAGTPAGLIVIALAATYLGVRSYQVWGGRRRLAIDPLVGRLENLRRRADRLSARAGRLRAASEPPLRFARRLRDEFADPAWADWYAAYADVRYDPSRDRAAVERVALGLEGLGRVPTRRPKS